MTGHFGKYWDNTLNIFFISGIDPFLFIWGKGIILNWNSSENYKFQNKFPVVSRESPKDGNSPIIKICGQFKIPYSNLLTNQNKVFSLLTLIFTSRFRKMLLSGNFGMENQTA